MEESSGVEESRGVERCGVERWLSNPGARQSKAASTAVNARGEARRVEEVAQVGGVDLHPELQEHGP